MSKKNDSLTEEKYYKHLYELRTDLNETIKKNDDRISKKINDVQESIKETQMEIRWWYRGIITIIGLSLIAVVFKQLFH
jgi:lysozyme family protein